MALFSLSFLSLLFIPSSFLSFSVILLLFWFYYLSSSIFIFNQGYYIDFYSDEVSLFMVYMLVFVLFVSFVYAISFKSDHIMAILFLAILFFCFEVFTTSSLFLLYLFYEASLLPILYIILKWGSYPERSVSAVMLLIYTSIFTFPFIGVLFSVFTLNGTFVLSSSSMLIFHCLDPLSSLIIFFTFAVNLPVYGLHFWLPIAHVEAPTFGSIILAGILLNLGGVGLIRCIGLLSLDFLYSVFLAYFIIFIVYVTIVCIFQSDLNRLVAYSSVSHIIAIPLLVLSNNLLSVKTIVLLMLFHGLSSPILFMLVGVLYSFYSSRQLIVIRGLMLVSPLLSFIIVLAFFFTLSAPPFPSFVSEVYFFISSFSLSSYLVYVFIIFSFLSLVYNLNWLSSMVFSSASPSNISVTLTYMSFMPLITSILICLPFILLVYLL